MSIENKWGAISVVKHEHTNYSFLVLSLSTSDIVGIGFEEEVIIVPETVGTVSICVVTNLTLDERHTASAILQTEAVSAEG